MFGAHRTGPGPPLPGLRPGPGQRPLCPRQPGQQVGPGHVISYNVADQLVHRLEVLVAFLALCVFGSGVTDFLRLIVALRDVVSVGFQVAMVICLRSRFQSLVSKANRCSDRSMKM